ncbi:MAG: hypothetical protein WCT25_02880, partial [Candidatus Paceibacterota bacterium]
KLLCFRGRFGEVLPYFRAGLTAKKWETCTEAVGFKSPRAHNDLRYFNLFWLRRSAAKTSEFSWRPSEDRL